jgi:hypothetical protein
MKKTTKTKTKDTLGDANRCVDEVLALSECFALD